MVCGIICEYNPFHNGHKYQIDTARHKYGCDAVVCIMSGSYTQRGDVAVLDKYTRARAALACGADLVLELPALHTIHSAEIFASNAVYTLNSLGIIDVLAFGSESEDLSPIEAASDLFTDEPPKFREVLKRELSSGKPYFYAREAAASEVLGKSFDVEILRRPNNILAIEYLKSLRETGSNIKPLCIPRKGCGHNDTELSEYSSATAVRAALLNGDKRVMMSVPECCRGLYKDAPLHSINRLDTAVITNILKSSPEDIRSTPDVSEGLENRIYAMAKKSRTIAELCDKVKSKRYTHSRIRRILLNHLLGITKSDMHTLPQYIKILDFNEKGQELLHTAKKTAALSLAKNRNGVKAHPNAVEIWDRELIFDSIYSLTAIEHGTN